MSSTLIGTCKTCGHDQTKHKGIDPQKRLGSRCTALQTNEVLSEATGRIFSGPLRCMCDNYITDKKDRH